MSHLVFCTFDLKDASLEDYRNAFADLEGIGLTRVQKSDKGDATTIPTTSAMGRFHGKSSVEVRDDVRSRVKAAFVARRFRSEFFVAVGEHWAWAAEKT